MKTIIYPNKLEGSIDAIGSKSITHRFLFQAIKQDKVIINNPNLSNDIFETINALIELGLRIDIEKEKLIVYGNQRLNNNVRLKVSESATTLRYLIPILSLLKISASIEISEKLRARLLNIDFKDLALDYTFEKNCLLINPTYQLKDNYLLNFYNSSQVISGFLIALSLIDNNTIVLIKKPVDKYIELTIDTLEKYHNIIEKKEFDDYFQYKITPKKNQNLIVDVEGDYSNMSYILACGLNSNIKVNNLFPNSKQPDYAFIEILKKANANILIDKNSITISKSNLTPLNVDLKYTPDLGPILMAIASTINKKSTFINYERTIYKESNRLLEVLKILKMIGATIELEKNTLFITGPNHYNEVKEFDARNDHRIVFMLNFLSSYFDKPIIINGSEAVNKSYKEFFNDIKRLKGGFNHENESKW